MERDLRRRVAGFSWLSISWGTCTLSRRVYPRSDGPRQRSVYTVKPEACDRIAGYIRCYEVGRSHATRGRRDANIHIVGSKSAVFFSRYVKIFGRKQIELRINISRKAALFRNCLVDVENNNR